MRQVTYIYSSFASSGSTVDCLRRTSLSVSLKLSDTAKRKNSPCFLTEACLLWPGVLEGDCSRFLCMIISNFRARDSGCLSS